MRRWRGSGKGLAIRLARGLLAVLALGALGPAAVARAAPPPGISLDVEVGYDGWVQPGRVNPVIVDLENTSADLNLSGDLVLEYAGVEYVTRLELPTPSRKRFYLYFPCDAWPPYLVLRVRTKAYTEQFELNPIYKTMRGEDLSVVVLTKQGGSLGVVNQLPCVRLYRNLYTSNTAELGSAKVYVAYYDLDEIDPTPKFFARADMIVLADVDYQQVTQELAEALKACVAGGTSIVFSLGLNGAGVAASPLADLCPLEPSGTVQVSDLGSFGQLYGISAAQAPATFATGDLARGAEVASWAAGYPAVVRQGRGSGRVTALAFDFTAVPFKQNPALAGVFVDHALKVTDSVAVTNWFIHPEPVSRILRQLSEAKPMTPGFVLLFLALYIVLIGPLNFLILSRLKRRTLVWTTIPLIIIGFSYLGLSTGYLYRGSDNVCAYFQELHVFPGAAYTPYQTVMLVFTADRTHYELVVPDRSAFLYPDIPNVIDQYSLGGGGGTRLRGLTGASLDNSTLPVVTATQGKWTNKEFVYQGYLGLPVTASAELTAVHGQGSLSEVRGGFSLDLPFDLYDCYLYAPHLGPGRGGIDLGDLPGQGTYELPLASKSTVPGGGLPQGSYLVESRRDFSALEREASEFSLGYRDELLLVGYTPEVEALARFDRPHAEHRLTMVVVHLPYRPILPRQGSPVVSRTRLVGGAGFQLRESYWRYQVQTERKQYALDQGGFIDVSYEVAGRVDGDSRLIMHVKGLDAAEGYELENLAPLLDAEVWNGSRWVAIQLGSGTRELDLPLTPYLDSKRQVMLRLRARGEFILEIPWAEVY